MFIYKCISWDLGTLVNCPSYLFICIYAVEWVCITSFCVVGESFRPLGVDQLFPHWKKRKVALLYTGCLPWWALPTWFQKYYHYFKWIALSFLFYWWENWTFICLCQYTNVAQCGFKINLSGSTLDSYSFITCLVIFECFLYF